MSNNPSCTIASMSDPIDFTWMEARLEEKAEKRKQDRDRRRDPNVVVIDAGKFTGQLAALSETLMHKLEREGASKIPHSTIPADIAVILRQLSHTYGLMRFLTSDEKRDRDPSYRQAFSFVVLPLVRTMIDGFYNCTALLDDPSKARIFRISGLHRMRASLRSDEKRNGQDPRWLAYLVESRRLYELGMHEGSFSDADLDNKANEWPLLGKYLGQKPDTPHKQMLRELTHGFWKEYSSISHVSYDGLVSIYRFIADDAFSHEHRMSNHVAGELYMSMHFGRTAALLLCLLTEIQHFFRFEGTARIDERLSALWIAMSAMNETKWLYESRYSALLQTRSG